jgi:hypothetical protein
MTDMNAFENLMRRLIASDPGRPALLPVTDDEAGVLRTGLECALLDRAAFDRLILLYPDDAPGSDPRTPSFPPHLLPTILERGLGELDGPALVSLALSPNRIAELWEALATPSRHWLDAADRLRWGTSTGPRYPGRVLLGIPGPVAAATLRLLLRGEVEDALGLAPSLPNARLARWATDRRCGPEPLPSGHRRPFYQTVAEVIRDVREAAINRAFAQAPLGHTTRIGAETLAQLPTGASFDSITSEVSEAAAALAQASRALDVCDPDLGQPLLLAYYGGLSTSEVATLLGFPEDKIRERLDDAERWVHGQVTFHTCHEYAGRDEVPETRPTQPFISG